MTIGDLINSIVQQVVMQCGDQEREATLEDVVAIMQTVTIFAKAFAEKAIQESKDKANAAYRGK